MRYNDTVKLFNHLSSDYLSSMYTSNNWTCHVDSKEKEIVFRMLGMDDIKLIKKEMILDLGMGPGRWSKFFIDNGFKYVYGLDIAEKMKVSASKYVNSVRFKSYSGDMKDRLFRKNYFDKIFCFRAFKYSSDPLMVLKEAGRAIKTNGSILLEVSNKTLMNIVLVCISRFINILNSKLSLESHWRYYLRTNFYSQKDIECLVKLANLRIVNFQALFILPSIPLPGNNEFVWFWQYLDKLLFLFLPKRWFARSWLFLLKKKTTHDYV